MTIHNTLQDESLLLNFEIKVLFYMLLKLWAKRKGRTKVRDKTSHINIFMFQYSLVWGSLSPPTQRSSQMQVSWFVQCFGKDISNLIFGANKIDLDSSISHMFPKMMILEGNMFCAWSHFLGLLRVHMLLNCLHIHWQIKCQNLRHIHKISKRHLVDPYQGEKLV